MSDQPEPPGPNPYQQDPQQPPQQNPYYPQGQPQQPAPPPYGAPQQQPYGQPQYEQYGQQYQQQYAQPYAQQQYPPAAYPYAAPVPNHPSANTSMVLGIIALAGVATCAGITLVLSPFAWIIGAKATREIDANPGAYGGRGSAQAGKIMGIIGTVLLVVGILFFAFIIGIALVSDSSTTYDTYNSNT